MSSSTLLEIFGHVLFSFTKSVTDHYNPEEPEFNNELFGYNPLESTGREWYYHPVDELIYQVYGGKDLITSTSYLAASSLDVKVIDACSTEVNETSERDKSWQQQWHSLEAFETFRLPYNFTIAVYRSLDFIAGCYHLRCGVHFDLLSLLWNYQCLWIRTAKDINSPSSSVDANSCDCDGLFLSL